MSHLTIAIDLSENSSKIASQGLSYAKMMGIENVELTYVHQLSAEYISSGYGMPYSGLIQVDEEGIETRVKSEMQGIIDRLPKQEGVKVTSKILRGHPVDEIVKLCTEQKSKYLVIGLKSHNFVEKLFIGSIAGACFRESPCSVLGIHPEANDIPQKVMYACDFSNSNIKAFGEFQEISKNINGSGTLYHVVNPQSVRWEHQVSKIPTTMDSLMEQEKQFAQENFENMKNEMSAPEKVNVLIEYTLETRPEFKIIETIEREKVDLIVVGAHNYTGIKRFLMGSTSQFIVSNMPCSVLVAK
jgi:nucleotide-binding universal stress UspA family protein